MHGWKVSRLSGLKHNYAENRYDLIPGVRALRPVSLPAITPIAHTSGMAGHKVIRARIRRGATDSPLSP